MKYAAGQAARPGTAPVECIPDCRVLTVRERDVLFSLTSGATDRQIAARLGVSPRTVHKHLEHVYRKLGVATRTAAVMRVIDQLISGR